MKKYIINGTEIHADSKINALKMFRDSVNDDKLNVNKALAKEINNKFSRDFKKWDNAEVWADEDGLYLQEITGTGSLLTKVINYVKAKGHRVDYTVDDGFLSIDDSVKDADTMKFFDETLNFDRTARCDWCGKTTKTAITHFGTSHYNRLICKACAESLLKEYTHDSTDNYQHVADAIFDSDEQNDRDALAWAKDAQNKVKEIQLEARQWLAHTTNPDVAKVIRNTMENCKMYFNAGNFR